MSVSMEGISTQSSASTTLTYMPVALAMPVLTAPPWPLLTWWIARTLPGQRRSYMSASSGVPSEDPSSTINTSMSLLSVAESSDSTQRSRYVSMLYAGTTKVSIFFSCIFFLG